MLVVEKGPFNKKQYFIRTKEINYIGHTLSTSGLSLDVGKSKSSDTPSTTATEQTGTAEVHVGSSISLIHTLSDISTLLRKVLESDTEFHWRETKEEI